MVEPWAWISSSSGNVILPSLLTIAAPKDKSGSCHVLSKSDYPLPEEFETAYKNVDQVVFETDIDELRSPQNQLLLISKGMYTGNDTLENKLPKKAYESLVKYCNDNTIPINIIQKNNIRR